MYEHVQSADPCAIWYLRLSLIPDARARMATRMPLQAAARLTAEVDGLGPGELTHEVLAEVRMSNPRWRAEEHAQRA